MEHLGTTEEKHGKKVIRDASLEPVNYTTHLLSYTSKCLWETEKEAFAVFVSRN